MNPYQQQTQNNRMKRQIRRNKPSLQTGCEQKSDYTLTKLNTREPMPGKPAYHDNQPILTIYRHNWLDITCSVAFLLYVIAFLIFASLLTIHLCK